MKILWIIYPFCSIFMFVGAFLSIWVLLGILKSRSVSQWPVVDATVDQCKFETHSSSEGGDSFEVVVEYSYLVHGRKYQGNKIHPGYSASSFEGHKPLFEKLKSAKAVKVRYNEVNPAEAYLVSGFFSSSLAGLFAGLLFFLAGLCFLLIFHFAFAGNSDFASGLDVVR